MEQEKKIHFHFFFQSLLNADDDGTVWWQGTTSDALMAATYNKTSGYESQQSEQLMKSTTRDLFRLLRRKEARFIPARTRSPSFQKMWRTNYVTWKLHQRIVIKGYFEHLMIAQSTYIPITVMRTYQCYTYISVTLAVQCSIYLCWLCHCRLSCNRFCWASLRKRGGSPLARWHGPRQVRAPRNDLRSVYCTCSLNERPFYTQVCTPVM